MSEILEMLTQAKKIGLKKYPTMTDRRTSKDRRFYRIFLEIEKEGISARLRKLISLKQFIDENQSYL